MKMYPLLMIFFAMSHAAISRILLIEGIVPNVGVSSSALVHCERGHISTNILTCFHEDNLQTWQRGYFQYNWNPSLTAIDTTDMDSSTIWYSSSYVGNFADGDCLKKIDITKVVRDTIIHDRLCRVIGVFNGDEYLPKSEIITFVKERKFYFYEDNVWKLLYDFDMQAGDTLSYFISKKYPYFETMTVPSPLEQNILDDNQHRLVIMQIDTIFDATGKPVKRFHSQNLENTTGHSMGIIIENVGSIQKLFGSNTKYVGPECIETDWTGLRCYSDDNSSIKFVSGKCDEITSVKNGYDNEKVSISPNPGTDQVAIQMTTDVVPPLHCRITDMRGRVVEIGCQDQDHWAISTGQLMPDWYIIKIVDAKGRHCTNKWVKQ